MCRSIAQGGRRCPTSGTGHSTTGRTGTPAPSRTANPNTASGTGGGVPSRHRTDALAANLPGNRTGWDGKPLDDRGRRLYALRESGYTGPIDQDGYPDTTSEAAGILRRMAQDRGERPSW